MAKPIPSPLSDDFKQLLAEVRAGSRQALGRVLEHFRVALLHRARRNLDTALKAKAGESDLVQLTFLEACRDFDDFKGNSPEELLAWLWCICRHNLASLGRHYRACSKRRIAREVSLDDPEWGKNLKEHLLAADPLPDAEAVRHEEAATLQQALERLPASDQGLLRLRLVDHCTLQEIGARLQITANAAELRYRRAIRHLAKELGSKERGPAEDPGDATPSG